MCKLDKVVSVCWFSHSHRNNLVSKMYKLDSEKNYISTMYYIRDLKNDTNIKIFSLVPTDWREVF